MAEKRSAFEQLLISRMADALWNGQIGVIYRRERGEARADFERDLAPAFDELKTLSWERFLGRIDQLEETLRLHIEEKKRAPG